jgi:hypothetical protein
MMSYLTLFAYLKTLKIVTRLSCNLHMLPIYSP